MLDGDRHALDFYSLNTKQKMSVTEKHGTKSAERVLQIVVDANTPAKHRQNLHSIIVQWLRHNNETSDEENQSIYLTFHTLNLMLKELEVSHE